MTKDGWITCDFTTFSTVFQSYQEFEFYNERLCAMEPRFPPTAGLESETAKSVGKRLTGLQMAMGHFFNNNITHWAYSAAPTLNKRDCPIMAQPWFSNAVLRPKVSDRMAHSTDSDQTVLEMSSLIWTYIDCLDLSHICLSIQIFMAAFIYLGTSYDFLSPHDMTLKKMFMAANLCG